MKEKFLWFISGGALFFIIFLVSGGLYTITPPQWAGGYRLQDEPADGKSMAGQDLWQASRTDPGAYGARGGSRKNQAVFRGRSSRYRHAGARVDLWQRSQEMRSANPVLR